MPTNACEQCRHLKASTIKTPPGERVPKRKLRLICTERRMNVSGRIIVHCSAFDKLERRGRSPKGDK